jgi:UDP-2-acetamido-3-amino-2,3-dideoxy-glucuronate N-acetyltransferase
MIHPLASVATGVEIGEGSDVWAYATVGKGTKIGRGCVIGSNAYIGTGCEIGDCTRIQHGVFLPNSTMIGQRVFIGPNATFTDDLNPRAGNTFYKAQPPLIADDVAIGAGAVILPGVILEEGCVIGAGAVVVRRVPRHVTVVGNPAIAAPDMKHQRNILDKICRMFEAAAREWEA